MSNRINLAELFYILLLSCTVQSYNGFVIKNSDAANWTLGYPIVQYEHPAVTRFRSYLRIETVHPNPDPGYKQAIDWLKNQADEIGLDFNLAGLGAWNEFALWMTWNGSNPNLKSILFNSHMDVVAAQAENWIYPPFEAHKDDDGNIFARGATDMKCATMGTLEAIRRLKASGFQPLRTIHVSVIPDEEEGGLKGLKPFVKSDFFKKLNVAFDVDDGGTNAASDSIAIAHAEKTPWEFNITARGVDAHASNLPQYTSGQRLQTAINKLFEFRQQQFNKLQSGQTTFDDLTTVNLVKLNGGFANNVIPNLFNATFDMRIRVTPTFNFTTATKLLEDVVDAAKVGSTDPDIVTIDFILKSMETGQTAADNTNIWWNVVQDACNELNVKCPAVVTSAYSDGRYVRTLDIPVLGIGPFLNTPFTGHMDNEVINENEFLNAIDRYVTFIKNYP